jgi:hypothetical protein
MPEAGEYLFSRVGFSRDETPEFTLTKSEGFIDFNPLEHKLTLQFIMNQRFCIGWSDMTEGKRYTCPDANLIGNAYEQCAACQQRTGFNPAFYNAKTVSSQQEARNTKPHILYLAYFSNNTIKVGISYAARGNSRLLEQGARHALILDTFPSAHIARSYEAKIAQMPGISETVQLRKKITLLGHENDTGSATNTLLELRAKHEHDLRVTFARNHVQSFDTHYFPTIQPDLHSPYDCSDQHVISGKTIGMLGSLLFCQQEDTSLFLPLKKYIGYKVNLSFIQTTIAVPPRQTSLF